MKTITEYQPMIFSAMITQSARRQSRQLRQRKLLPFTAVGMLLLYVLLALKITSDTGLAVWDPRFWAIFAPLFILGERLFRLIPRIAADE